MNTPEFDFTAEQPNRLFEKWWAEQAEYRHRQTGISEARAIWLCSWRAYGEACRAATLAPTAQKPVAYEFWNHETGHCIVDYNERTYAGHLTKEKGYTAHPLVYAHGVATAPTEDATDAKRYRWLRSQDWFNSDLCVLRDPKRVLTRGIGLGADCPSHLGLDEAIDAAMLAASPVPPAPATGEQEREAFEKWFSGDGKWPKGIERDKWRRFARAILAAKGET